MEEVTDISYVSRLKFFFGGRRVDLKVEIKEVLGLVIVVHANVLQGEVYPDAIVGQVGEELYELVPEVFDKMIIDVGDPSLGFDRDVLIEKMDAALFLHHRLHFDHVFALQSPQNLDFFKQFPPLLQIDFENLPDEDPGVLIGALITLPKGIVLLHRDNNLFGHSSPSKPSLKKIMQKLP